MSRISSDFLYAFPVIFIDTVLFKNGTLIKRAGGVWTPWTPSRSAPDTMHVHNIQLTNQQRRRSQVKIGAEATWNVMRSAVRGHVKL